jgi:hypothetical protein
MKTLHCDYFPQLPARWHCPTCKVNLSAPCIKARNNDWDPVPEHRCPICLGKVESLGVTHSIPPFWTRIPQFLAYPLKLEAMAYLLCASLINFLSILSIDKRFDIILQGLSVTASAILILLYAFTCLNHTAKGHLHAPLSATVDNYPTVKMSLIAKQLAVYGVFILSIIFSAVLGKYGVIVCTAFILLALPASTMILAFTGTVSAAVNPLHLLDVIKTIGWHYIVFYTLLLLMLACQFFLQSESFQHLPSLFILPIIVFVQGYFSFVMFTMMGYVMYQYHKELGINQVQEFSHDEKKVIPELSPDPFMNEITILLREEQPDIAIKRLKARIYDTGQLNYCERLNQILQTAGYEEELLQNSPIYIDAIFRSKESENKKLQMAAVSYQACLRIKPDFFYPRADLVFNLAHYANEHAKHSLTRGLLLDFHLHFPDSKLIPQAYFLLATTLVDHLGDDKTAKQVLLFVQEKYPEHQLIPLVQEYLQLASQLER